MNEVRKFALKESEWSVLKKFVQFAFERECAISVEEEGGAIGAEMAKTNAIPVMVRSKKQKVRLYFWFVLSFSWSVL